MPSPWFTSKGQVIQVAAAIVGCIFAGVKAWPDVRSNEFLTLGAILFYVLVSLVVVSIVVLIRALHRGRLHPDTNDRGVVNLNFRASVLEPRATSPKTKYPAKLRISITNEGEKTIHVLPPLWTTGVGNVSVQSGRAIYDDVPYTPELLGFGHQYQLEKYVGGWKDGAWRLLPAGAQDEHRELEVPPGWTFRIWVGLDPTVPHTALQSLGRARHLGKLTIPVVIENRKYEVHEVV
jgi:hypothetical protein